jgi:hypothetical protein
MRCIGWLAASLFLVAACGCGPATGTVSGKVTIDGQPLDKGIISFAAAEGTAQPATADITNGHYSATMQAGKKFVQISAPISVGKIKVSDAPGAQPDDKWEERLPPKFNSESKLEFEVQRGVNAKDWETQSIRGAKKK